MNPKQKKIVTWLLSLVLVGCVVYIGVYLLQRTSSRRLANELAAMHESAAALPTPTPTPQATATPQASAEPEASATPLPNPEPVTLTVLPEYGELYLRNPDLVGWVKIEGTNIDYPVMYSVEENGQYYLYRDFDGKDDKAGTVFLDARCQIWPRSTNLLVHGHNMRNGSMFHNLRYYKDPAFREEHPTVVFDTVLEKSTYEVFAVLEVEVLDEEAEGFRYYRFINAATEDEFDEFIRNVQATALYDTGVMPIYGEEILTLSTCDYIYDDGRLAVLARRVS